MERSFILFDRGIKNERTRKDYHKNLIKFMNYCDLDSYDELSSHKDARMMIEDYAISLQRLKRSSVKAMLASIRKFYDRNEVPYNRGTLLDLYPRKTKKGGEKPYSTEDIKKVLSVTKSLMVTALIHFLASTGIRPGGLYDPV